MNQGTMAFEKKELAYSSALYGYLPIDFPVYTVEVTHGDKVNGELLQTALDKTLKRMPYLGDTLLEENGRIYYAKNPLPMEVACYDGIRRVGGEETNYHLLDLTWYENTMYFSMYHGFCDGQGIYAFMESVLYHYYCLKDGVAYEANGIRHDGEQMNEEEEFEPLSGSYEVPADYVMPQPKMDSRIFHIPSISQVMTTQVNDYEFRLPSQEFMRFVKEAGATPSVVLSILVGDAIRKVWPDEKDMIVANIPISIRSMLGCNATFKNCTHVAVLPVVGLPMDQMPFAQRATAIRGILDAQKEPNFFRFAFNIAGANFRERMEKATSYVEEIQKGTIFNTSNTDTFFMDYIGSMHKTDYAKQITDVRFRCPPAGNNTLHINVIEHNDEFRIDFLSCNDITPVIDAVDEKLKENGINFIRKPECTFNQPLSAWHEAVMKRLG